MVTGFDVVHVAAHLLDNTGAFVAKDHGQFAGVATVEKVHITVADTRRLGAN